MATLQQTDPPTPHIGSPTSRIVVGAALGLLSAGCLILAFPPYNVWPLIFVAFAPMLLADYRVLPPRWAGLASALGWGIWLLFYLTLVFGLSASTWFMQGVAVLVGVMNLAGGRGQRRFHEQTGYRWFVLFGIVATVGIEMVRSFIPLIATHGFVGHTLHTQPWLIQPASIFGIYGLDAWIALIGYALGLAAMALFDRRRQWDETPAVDRRLNARWLVGTAAAAAIWIALSLGLLTTAPEQTTVRAAGVQHGFVIPGHLDPENQTARLEKLAAGTREAAAQGARLVVWPELGLGFDPQAEHTEELRALAAETGASILVGYGLGTDAGWRNEAVLLLPSGEFLDAYGKNYPVGEPPVITAGRYLVYDTPLGRLAPIICNDVNYTAAVRTPARLGAQLVMVPTYMSAGIWRELQVQAVFRAVENRVATVMVDGAFRTTMVDPYGRRVVDLVTPAGGAKAVVADVPLGSAGTLYTRLGDWVGWLGLLCWILSMVMQSMEERKRKKAASLTPPG